jgi:hypothetical protein
MNNVITMRFSINCPTVICLPTVCYVLERDASSENYGPRVHPNHITKTLKTLLQFIYSYFHLQFIYLPLSELILAMDEYKGIDNPHARVGCKYFVCVCAGTVDLCLRESPIGSLTLVLYWGKYYLLLYCFTLPLRGKSQRSSQVAEICRRGNNIVLLYFCLHN